MDSLLVTLDPASGGGVRSMQRAVSMAHTRLGLTPHLAFARQGRLSRWNPALRPGHADGLASLSTGYLPTVEYLNYVVPALKMRRVLPKFPIVQLVSGFHSASFIPILGGRPFVSWIAAPFADEIVSRRTGAGPTPLSTRLDYGLRQLNQWVERWSLRYPKVIFALSEHTAARLAEVTGIARDRFSVLRCPVDVGLFSPAGRRWDAGPGRYLVSVGRVEDPRKNFSSLVRAFAPVAARHADLDLVIVGPMDRRDNLVARAARELGLASRVHFPGTRAGAELAAIYRGADAYVMTARQEGLRIVVMEAQASGLPVIAMRGGGGDELVDERGATRDGWLVDQGDEAGMARVLLDVLPDARLRAAAGAAARAKAEREHSHDVFTRRLTAAYQEVFPQALAELAG
jgi:glycosyltransferase involved in cell wall biosynthesis